MGPMGYGRGMMSLGGMVRGMGGYNPYQMQMARMAQMQGGYGMPRQQMGPMPQGGMSDADANAQGMAANQAAAAQKQQLMASDMSEEDAHRQAMQTYDSQMGPQQSGMRPISSEGMAGAAGNMQNALQQAYGAPARGMGLGGPMSLGALARMGMFRR